MEPGANARRPARSTALRQRLDSGGVAVAVASHSLTSDTVDFLGQFDFDAVWLEGEHGSVTWDRIASWAHGSSSSRSTSGSGQGATRHLQEVSAIQK